MTKKTLKNESLQLGTSRVYEVSPYSPNREIDKHGAGA